MNSRRQRLPLFLRSAIVATATGAVGGLIWAFGDLFIRSPGLAQVRDTVPMYGSAMMSVSSLLFILAAVLAMAHAARGRKVTVSHTLVMVIAGLVTITDAIVNR
ncbi:MAG: hypothetical protein AAGG48_28670 [Planctomycetota bacterium]